MAIMAGYYNNSTPSFAGLGLPIVKKIPYTLTHYWIKILLFVALLCYNMGILIQPRSDLTW